MIDQGNRVSMDRQSIIWATYLKKGDAPFCGEEDCKCNDLNGLDRMQSSNSMLRQIATPKMIMIGCLAFLLAFSLFATNMYWLSAGNTNAMRPTVISCVSGSPQSDTTAASSFTSSQHRGGDNRDCAGQSGAHCLCINESRRKRSIMLITWKPRKARNNRQQQYHQKMLQWVSLANTIG